MPIYEYRCSNGHEFEVFQNMSDDPVAACEQCGAPVERVFHPVAVHFKGSGFYTTDYAAKSKAGAADGESGGDSKPGESKAGDAKQGDSKPAKSDSKPDSKGGSSKSSGDSGVASKASSASSSD